MKNSSFSSRGLFLPCLVSSGFWLLTSTVLLLISCAIANSAEAPEVLLKPLTLTSLYLSTIICGIISVKLSGDGIMSGIISGIIIALVLLLMSAFSLPDSEISLIPGIFLLVAVIPAAMVGAFIGKKKNKRKKSMLRKRH